MFKYLDNLFNWQITIRWFDRKPFFTGALGATLFIVLIGGLVYVIFLDGSTAPTSDLASVLKKGEVHQARIQWGKSFIILFVKRKCFYYLC